MPIADTLRRKNEFENIFTTIRQFDDGKSVTLD